jgi:hypothetical protein
MVALLALTHARAGTDPAEAHYMIHCQGCHLPDGVGKPGAVPSLTEDLGKFLHMPGGREYLVQVPGTANAPLDDAAVAALLNWMIATYARADLPAGFRPYTAAEVTRYRAERLIDPATRRAALLARLEH